MEQKQMEVLSREDVKRVLSVCGTRDRALVLTLIDSGVRRGEALALNWEDVDFHTGAVHMRRGKGGKARVTYVGAKTRRALRNGMDLLSLQRLLGHSSREMVRKYAHQTDKDLRSAHAYAGPIDNSM